MIKNKKLLFLSLTLVMLIACVGVVSAANDTDTGATETITVPDVVPSIEDDSANVPDEDDNQTDFYVSDSAGDDNNAGTQDSPYKTIQTALDRPHNDQVTYNIYILAGNYTGLGNTNLTVNGNYNINIIGEGTDKTIIDGEAGFDIIYSGFYWGSSDIWKTYTNETGNWGMNITQGNGRITLSNFTIEHCYSQGVNGGSAIGLYPVATVDNHANLEVDNMYFFENYAGVGAGIRNNANATLIVNNSVFEKNQKSSSTGNYGPGVYNNGTATILNSIFDNNYARWGVVMNDHSLVVGNCTFQNGIGYDGSSTYKFGTGVAFNTGASDFNRPGNYLTDNIVENCTFINNYQSDIYGFSGSLIANNNTFINTSRIYITDSSSSDDISYVISNNTIINPVASTLQASLSTGSNTYAIQSSVTNNKVLIENNTIYMINGTAISAYNATINNNIITYEFSGPAIALSRQNAIVTNNTITRGNITVTQASNTIANNTINVDNSAGIILNTNNAKNNTITGNTIYSNSTYAVNIATASGNNVSDNYLVASPYVGNLAVRVSGTNTVENNLPEAPVGIYARADITSAQEGTMANPTSIADAITKVTDDVNTIYLLTDKGNFVLSSPLMINSDNVATKNITITGLGSTATISGNKATQILNIADDYTVTINNVSFVDGLSEYGAAIYTEGNLTVENSSFIRGNATIAGGAVYANKSANVVLNNNEFTDVSSEDETIYFNSEGTITVTENTYDNCAINLNNFTITGDESNPNPVKVNDTVKFNIGEVTLLNPTWYDADITNNITYDVYENDELVDSISEKSYEITPINPETFTTYVNPTFTQAVSNVISTDIYYPESRKVNMTVSDVVVFENDNAKFNVELTDEFNLTVKNGTISYYNGTSLLGTSNVENGVSSFTYPVAAAGLSTITVVYNDSTALYANTTQDVSLIILDNVYVSPEVTEAAAGLRNNPTTIEDALSKVQNGKSIIFLDGTYKLNNNTISINSSTTNADTFNLIGETSNVILDGENLAQIMNIASGKTITIENITFTNGNASNGASIENAGELVINNSKFTNGYTSSSSGAIYNNRGTLIVYNSEFSNNNGETGGITYSSYGSVLIDNCTFINNTARSTGLFYLSSSISNENYLIVNNSKFYNNTARTSILYTYQADLGVADSVFDNNDVNDRGIFVAEGNSYGSNNDIQLIIANSNVTNNHVNNSAAIAYITGHVNATITNNSFENDTAGRTGGIYAYSRVSDVTITNNTFKNIKTNDETNYLSGSSSFTVTENTYENCTIGFNLNLALSDDTTIPVKINDEVTVNAENFSLKNPTWYDSNILDDYTYNTFLNDQQVGTMDSTQTAYKVTPTKAGDTTTYVTTSFSNSKSNILTFDVQDGDLKNTVISADKVQGNLNDGATITVTVTDKDGNLVEDGGIVSLYDANGTLIGNGSTVNGSAIITTNPITELGMVPITIMYNASSTYNNQTNTTTVVMVMNDVYVSPDVEEAKAGTIDDPTTLQDAISKVANNGTIHILKGTDGIYLITERVTLNDGLSELTTEFTINGEEEGIKFNGNDTVSIFEIDRGYTITISNLTFEHGGYNYAYGGAINNAGNLTVVNDIFRDCYGINGGSLQTTGLLNVDNCTFENSHATNGGAIYANGGTLLNIKNSVFNNVNASSTSTSSTPYGGAVYTRNTNVTIENSTFNNLSAGRNGGFIYIQGGNVIISNNSISNVVSPDETNYVNSGTIELSGNTYNNCTIGTSTLTIESEKTDLTVNEEANINITNVTLNHPTWYDEDILNNSAYEIYVNNISVGNTKSDNINIKFSKYGVYELLVKESFSNVFSNNITFTVSRTDSSINVYITDEYNESIAVTVLDIDNNIITEGNISVSSEDYNTTVQIAENGTTIISLPEGEYELTVSFEGNNVNNPVNDTLSINHHKVNTTIALDDITGYVGDNITIKAYITDALENNVNGGKAVFKINGKTIGSVTVQNGIATINTTITKAWTGENIPVEVIYSGTSKRYNSNRTTFTESMNVSYKTAIIKIMTSKTDYRAGDNITIITFIKDNTDKIVKSGTVIFKLNGITIKDENGKAITVKVKDGIAQLNYNLPGNSAGKNYTITAVFSDSTFERAEANSTISISKGISFIETSVIRVSNNTPAVLTGRIINQNNELVDRTFQVTVKINGITFANKVAVKNGIINITLDQSITGSTSIDKFKFNKLYDVLIIAGENTQYHGSNITTSLIKEE